MIVELTPQNKKKEIIYYCKKELGEITIKYIDKDTGELISEELNRDLEFGNYKLEPKSIEGYIVVNGHEVNKDIEEKREINEDVFNEADEEVEVMDVEIVEEDDILREMKEFKNMIELGDIVDVQ